MNNEITEVPQRFNVGDTVYWGKVWGIVQAVHKGTKTLDVEFADGKHDQFTYEGHLCRWVNDLLPFPSLSFTPYEIVKTEAGLFKLVGHTTKKPFIFTRG